ncbi:organic cation transporter-like protein [Gigantopelta aegis]|uniref:organic cation transporter-like protein n=1 Tax=Gigantopelta aegis TaxID=1735272 RepID=UPI001B889C28|nr:organic cation transporter-like protein [Gigantopelta aegis]
MGAMTGNIVGSVCITWSPSIPVFFVLIFVVCGSSMAAYLAAYVFGTELVGPSKRRFTGIIMNLFWSIGNLLVAAIVFFVRDWKYRQLAFSLPAVIFWSYFWYVRRLKVS